MIGLLTVACENHTGDALSASPEAEERRSVSSTTSSRSSPDQKVQPVSAPKQEPSMSQPLLLDPQQANEQCPSSYQIHFETTQGPFVVEVNRDWAPHGADRLYNLVKAGYFTDIAFFRVLDEFMAQFGISGDPAVSVAWRSARIPDDKVNQSNKRGYVTFATAGKDTRTTQLFINFKDNAFLDSQGFSPVGQVVQGMSVVDSLYKGYGEGAPNGKGPDQGRIQSEGNAYLKANFPKLDYIKSASIEEGGAG